VKFLVDANTSPRLAERLRAEGHDAVAVRDVGLAHGSDDEILDHAIDRERVIISHDTDFGALLAFRRLSAPSFILIRSSDPLTPDQRRVVADARCVPLVDTPAVRSEREVVACPSMAGAIASTPGALSSGWCSGLP
jgi:predicted nuclease of predicted toxin-antitoxin system